MKSYNQLSSAYIQANGLIPCRIVNQLGEERRFFLTEKQIKDYEKRGVTVVRDNE